MMELSGMYRWSKQEKIERLATVCFAREKEGIINLLRGFWHQDLAMQKLFDEFSENTLTNYYMPYGVAPYFLIDNKPYVVPMVIEESSVVAAASKSAKFWQTRGGFHTQVVSTTKVGQVHFLWEGDSTHLFSLFEKNKNYIRQECTDLFSNMEKRGGGLVDFKLKDYSSEEKNYYQIFATFETCDAMGANFINSLLERMAHTWKNIVEQSIELPSHERKLMIVMAILSNYTPECLVRASVSCPISELEVKDGSMTPQEYAQKFVKAVRIAHIDLYRATTHNKGIFNGVDAVVLATGNDFRAIEAAGHAYASRKGRYCSLSQASVEGDQFHFHLELPIAIGSVGGLTTLHPLAKLSLQLLGNPKASELMRIACSVGLAQNFAAVNSLITTGIQRGHMRMHLMNILNSLQATESERQKAKDYFQDKVISFKSVREFIDSQRCLH